MKNKGIWELAHGELLDKSGSPYFIGIFYKIMPIKVLTFLLVCIIINSTKCGGKEKANVNRKVCEQENWYCGVV